VTPKAAVIVAGWLLASASLGAGEFWEAKEFTAWSDQEVSRMLTDSPWSRRVVIISPDLSLASRVGGLSGGLIGNSGRYGRSGGGGVAGDGAGNMGGGSFLASPDRIALIVRWASARPVKQALARHGATRAELERVDQPESFYRFAVVGIPFGLDLGSFSDLQYQTILKPRRRAAIPAERVTLADEGGVVTIEFSFPRSAEITLEDDEVEFRTRVITSGLKTTFKLKELVVGKRLTL
jgi:hypothetical protein